MKNITDKMSDLYSETSALVEGSYHNLLWQVMVNLSTEGAGAFTVLHDGQLVIACPDGGYIPGRVYLVDKDDKAALCDKLNAAVFGLNPDGALEIVAKSLRKH